MKTELKVLLISTLVGVAAFAGLVMYAGSNRTYVDSSNVADPSLLVKADSHQKTTAPLKVTIVEFGDFECPACGLAHIVLEQLLNEYNGRVNFVFRHFPLNQHKNAVLAAKASEAAGEQGKFWEMHDKLYKNQTQWSDRSDADQTFERYAQEINLDVETFRASMNGDKYTQKVNTDRQDGLALGVNQTPTFYINSQKFTGALSYQDFKTAIEAELQK